MQKLVTVQYKVFRLIVYLSFWYFQYLDVPLSGCRFRDSISLFIKKSEGWG